MSMNTPQPSGQQPDPYAAQQGYPPQQAPYPQQPGPYPVPTAPQRNQLVFVVSILLIIGAALNIIAAIGLIGALALTGTEAGLFTALIILCFVCGAYMLVAALLGIKNAANPAKAGLLLNLGLGLVVLSLINAVISFIVTDEFSVSMVTGFLLPILYVVGALNLKKQLV